MLLMSSAGWRNGPRLRIKRAPWGVLRGSLIFSAKRLAIRKMVS